MNLANGLSLLRLVLTPVLLALLLWDPSAGAIAAAVVFFAAAVSDVLDGYFARRRDAVSKLGVFIDLVADKILTTCVLVALVELRVIHSWPVIVILIREFAITGLRTFAAAEGVVIPAAAWGKQKTAVTNLAIFWLILLTDYSYGGVLSRVPGAGPVLGLGPWVLYLGVLLTVSSGVRYLYSARGLLERMVR